MEKRLTVNRFCVGRSSLNMYVHLKEKTMKKLITLMMVLVSVLLVNNAFAGEDIVGKWEGKLVPAPGSELVVHFIITKADDGSYSVVLNSPDQGAIKNIKASSVVYDSGKLTMDVTDLSGSYEGIFKDGKFEGNWKQEGTSLPLNLSRYKKPVLSKEAQEILLGEWYGPLDIPQVSLTAVIRFEMKDGKFAGVLNVPEQGNGQTPLTDVVLDDGDFSFNLAGSISYKGKLANNEIVGKLLRPGQTIPITLKKGKYVVPTYSLNLPKETMDKLSGEWHGQLKMPTNIMHIIFEFKTTGKGEFVGLFGAPENKLKDIPFTEANLSDGKLALKTKFANGEFKGEIKGDKYTGIWSQAGLSPIILTMKKGEYVPPVYDLALPKDIKEQLTGEWHGQLKTPRSMVHVAFRFKTTEKGEFLGFYDLPDGNQKDLQIYEANLSDDGKLNLKIAGIAFEGELKGDEYTGKWTQQRRHTPVTMKKGKYVPPVYKLDQPKEIRELLSGEWIGEMGNLTVVLRFENTKEGDFLGFVDSPDQRALSIPITEMEFKENNITAQVPHVGGVFKGKLAENEMTGEWTQNARSNEVTFKKGKFVPKVYSLKLPKEIMNTLSGKWKGNLGNLEFQLRFEKTEKGDFVGFAAIPQQKVNDVPVSEANFNDGYLTLKFKLANIHIEGQLINKVFDANWIQGENKTPISLKKE